MNNLFFNIIGYIFLLITWAMLVIPMLKATGMERITGLLLTFIVSIVLLLWGKYILSFTEDEEDEKP